MRAGVPGHRYALHAGRLHGQSPEVHRQSPVADREAQDPGLASDPLVVSAHAAGAHHHVSAGHGPEVVSGTRGKV